MAGREVARRRVDKNLEMEGAEILFPNFTGVEGMYNKAGDRNFCVVLDEDTAEQMRRDGWNIKRRRAEGDPERGERTGAPYLQVAVGYGKGKPPYIVLITNGRQSEPFEERDVHLLDWIDIESADVIVRPYNWAVNGDFGVKAYVKELYVTQAESVFMRKYANMPKIGRRENLEIAAEPYEDDIIDGEVLETEEYTEEPFQIGRGKT